jgi:hypothetical protein
LQLLPILLAVPYIHLQIEVLRRPVEFAIAAAVGMEHRALRQVQVPGGHPDRPGNQRGLVIVVHRPPDDLPGRAVNDRREINPAFPRIDIRDIADHFPARLVRREITVHQVRDRPGLAVLLGQRAAPGLRLAGHQAQAAHDLPHGLVIDGLAAADQGGVDPPVPVLLVIRLEQCFYLDLQKLPAPRGLALRPAPPVVESRF